MSPQLQVTHEWVAGRLQVGLQVSKLTPHRALAHGGLVRTCPGQKVWRIWILLYHVLDSSLGIGASVLAFDTSSWCCVHAIFPVLLRHHLLVLLL